MKSKDLDELTQTNFLKKPTNKESEITGNHSDSKRHKTNKNISKTGFKTLKKSHLVGFTIALLAIIALFSITLQNSPEQIKKELGTFDEPETAFKECQKALKMISEQINSNEIIEPLKTTTNE